MDDKFLTHCDLSVRNVIKRAIIDARKKTNLRFQERVMNNEAGRKPLQLRKDGCNYLTNFEISY